MHYYQDPKHRIQADMAFRIGKIAMQYTWLKLAPKEDFTDTLHLCLLQNLLTNCKELLNAMNRDGGEDFGLHAPLKSKTEWGLDEIKITRYSFEENLTVADFLTHLRNAMSHPTGTNLNADFPSTGYNSIPDAAGMIAAIAFCDSPDTRNNRPRDWSSVDTIKKHFGTMPRDVHIHSVVRNRLGVFREGHPYAREFLAILTIEQLRSLVINLANLLAQPAREYWDGKSVIDMLAA